jgi:hypothetical protein
MTKDEKIVQENLEQPAGGTGAGRNRAPPVRVQFILALRLQVPLSFAGRRDAHLSSVGGARETPLILAPLRRGFLRPKAWSFMKKYLKLVLSQNYLKWKRKAGQNEKRELREEPGGRGNNSDGEGKMSRLC